MASREIRMPVVESGQETGFIVRWLKTVGDAVAEGEAVMEIESDKAIVQIESPGSGVLARIDFGDETEVPVGTVVGSIES
jgi:pyruvate/2-oxoglutarate dehydrogenase complex dihydrolipoamide acyltransferase (E2) component